MAKNQDKNRAARAAASQPAESSHSAHNATRETLESLAVAFILAFFIRTFVVEPFVIPTGSMSPALQGQHKDVNCPRCNHRYRVNASEQAQMRDQQDPEKCTAGMCPQCRYTMVYDTRLASNFRAAPDASADEPSYSGDRIIVNKFLYSFSEPQRWDVVVFKYPGSATDNYIKRLVGLPEETLQIYSGDLFVRPEGEEEFQIARKPPKVAYAMRQAVHNTDHDAAMLHAAGWPLRWQPSGSGSNWERSEEQTGNVLRQQYRTTGEGESWLRYIHTPPTNSVWPSLEAGAELPEAQTKLIGDFNSYNTRITLDMLKRIVNESQLGRYNPFVVPEVQQGIHWVGDLMVEADVEVQQERGQLLLELVEAGHRFRARIDLATGEARLEILPHGQSQPASQFAATAQTPIRGTGEYQVLFANVDDALYLWVDDRLMHFDQPTTYDWQALFGPRDQAVPQPGDGSTTNPGDLAPAGVGSDGAALTVDRLRVWRDIYYIAAKAQSGHPLARSVVTDYDEVPPPDILYNPDEWHRIGRRQAVEFDLATDQFFVMGDNSPQSSDARLWNQLAKNSDGTQAKPGGNYLERQLLIGRAISVVWPHTWHYVIPGFTDMRRIR